MDYRNFKKFSLDPLKKSLKSVERLKTKGEKSMKLRYLITLMIFLIQIPLGFARKPAVEDFMGVEVEAPKSPDEKEGTMFNFERNQANPYGPPEQILNQTTQYNNKTNWTNVLFGLIFVIGMPVSLWLVMISRLKKKMPISESDNLESLEKFKEKKQKKDSIRKAS